MYIFIFYMCTYVEYIYTQRTSQTECVYSCLFSYSKSSFSFPKPFCCLEQEVFEGAEVTGAHSGDAGEYGLGSAADHKLHCSVWSPWCVTHRINKAAKLRFCPWKLPFTSDNLFWQGYWLASTLLPSNVFKHWIPQGKLCMLPASEDHASKTANTAQTL